jgi:hypothetical protein
MPDNDQSSRNASRHSTPSADRGELTPPHGDELPPRDEPRNASRQSDSGGDLRNEETFGRTDRYANQDDPDAEPPVLDEVTLVSDEEMKADARDRRMEQIDDAAADDARMATRKREHSAD